MTKYVLLGIISLAMLMVLAASPVMADTNATLPANGSVVQTLAITNNAPALEFGQFVQGMNEKDNIGLLTITSNFVPNWKVTALTADGYGFMRIPPVVSGSQALATKLQEYNYLAGSPGWEDVEGMTFGGSASTSMQESFRQNVLITDLPGNYKTTITYTVAAV